MNDEKEVDTWRYGEKNPGRKKSSCQGHEMGADVLCLRDREQTCVARGEKRREVGGPDYEGSGRTFTFYSKSNGNTGRF